MKLFPDDEAAQFMLSLLLGLALIILALGFSAWLLGDKVVK